MEHKLWLLLEHMMTQMRTLKMEIKNIPDKSKDYFLALSKIEFNSNLAFTLKYLCDLHKGTLPATDEVLEARFSMIEDKISDLNKVLIALSTEPEKEGRKMLDGRTR